MENKKNKFQDSELLRGRKKKQIGWDSVEKYATTIVDNINASNLYIDLLVGISVSGMIPLVLVSKWLQNSNVDIINASSYHGTNRGELVIRQVPEYISGRSILLLDDIIATGTTFEQVVNILIAQGAAKVYTASLVVSSVVCPPEKYPNFYGALVDRAPDEWICFPWDEY